MKRKIVIFLLFLVVVGLGCLWWIWNEKNISPVGDKKLESKESIDYQKYDFDSLKDNYKQGWRVDGEVKITNEIEEVETRRKNLKYSASDYGFTSKGIEFVSGEKKISGMINYRKDKKLATIIMIRGYADKPGYYRGFGSWRMADELAKNGYNTISLDFLGYGLSDQESFDMLEARFEKVVNVIDLIELVKKLEFVDIERLGIWAHSNGGQIAISVLEITGENYPTVLWAPMTNPFPKSVLDTASDLDDGGKAVISAISDLEAKYDTRKFSIENYYENLNSPILIIQGTVDPWCEVAWQEEVRNKAAVFEKKVDLEVLKGVGHNMEGGWDKAAEISVKWLKQYI